MKFSIAGLFAGDRRAAGCATVKGYALTER